MTNANATTVRKVDRFEAQLVRLTRCVVRGGPIEPGLVIATSARAAPRCLSRAAVELVQDALAKGFALRLARGGWAPQRTLDAQGAVRSGRAWERHPGAALGLSCSRRSLQLLVWLTAQPLPNGEGLWMTPPADLTIGDRFLLLLAHATFRNTTIGPALRRIQGAADDGLFALTFPDDRADEGRLEPPEFGPWTSGPGAAVLECWQGELADRWLRVERKKHQMTDWRRFDALGRQQQGTLHAFLAACESANRRDLARFLVAALAPALADESLPRPWYRQLNHEGRRLGERIETARAGAAPLRALQRLSRWEADARGVSFYDERYAASQLWKSEWEARDGDALSRRATETIRELEPLAV